ncbi:MAG: hydrogenase/urease maturation nickel metallochaperone HypA [bacterium]|nr:hydrogenase/urease maturation nickel metallochaperone HypA [bacterium]
MHEYHVIEPMVKEILKTAADRKAVKVVKVTLAMGDKTGFDEGSVKLYFETMGEGTLLAGAEVVIKRLAGSKEFYIENIEIEE